jgi:hypothetical protein
MASGFANNQAGTGHPDEKIPGRYLPALAATALCASTHSQDEKLCTLDNQPNSVADKVAGLRQDKIDFLRGEGHFQLDAKNEGLSQESLFDLAYNAAHALSLAALRHTAYRSENRYLVFQCTQHTLDLEAEQWRVLDRAHRKRNLAEYEGDMDVDAQLLEALIRVAELIARKLQT